MSSAQVIVHITPSSYPLWVDHWASDLRILPGESYPDNHTLILIRIICVLRRVDFGSDSETSEAVASAQLYELVDMHVQCIHDATYSHADTHAP